MERYSLGKREMMRNEQTMTSNTWRVALGFAKITAVMAVVFALLLIILPWHYSNVQGHRLLEAPPTAASLVGLMTGLLLIATVCMVIGAMIESLGTRNLRRRRWQDTDAHRDDDAWRIR